MKPYRLAFFVSHPIQYQAPLLRLIGEHPEIDLQVFFLTDQSTDTYFDVGFNKEIKWDIPLTEGYTNKFLDGRTQPNDFSIFNPRVKSSKIKKVICSQRWDAIWIHGYNNLALLYIIWLCRRNRTPLLFSADSNLASSPQGPLKDLFIRQLVKQAHGLLWVSSDNRDYYSHYGALEEQLFFTPFAVDNSFFQSYRMIEESSNMKCIILFTAKLIPCKLAPLLVQAFAGLDSSLRDKAELWIIGDGIERIKIEALVADLKMHDHIKLLGFKNQTELPSYMSKCDVFVLPSERDNFGLVINEVMNFGKAVITTHAVGAARDLVAHGVNGWVIEPGSLDALQTALTSAIKNPEQLERMGEQSLLKINQWSYEQDLDGILSALRETERK